MLKFNYIHIGVLRKAQGKENDAWLNLFKKFKMLNLALNPLRRIGCKFF